MLSANSDENAHFVELARLSTPSVQDSKWCAARLAEEVTMRPLAVAHLAVLVADAASPAVWLVLQGKTGLATIMDTVLADAGLADSVEWRWRGQEATGIVGPESGSRPAVAAVAVRHLRDAKSAHAVLGLLHRTGDDWKQDFPGFIAATPFLGVDDMSLVNYPRWASQSAYDDWMAEPRMRAGQQEVSAHESAPPEYHVLNVHTSLSAEYT